VDAAMRGMPAPTPPSCSGSRRATHAPTEVLRFVLMKSCSGVVGRDLASQSHLPSAGDSATYVSGVNGRQHSKRPVTPEAAGSSPVHPAEITEIWNLRRAGRETPEAATAGAEVVGF